MGLEPRLVVNQEGFVMDELLKADGVEKGYCCNWFPIRTRMWVIVSTLGRQWQSVCSWIGGLSYPTICK